MLWRSAVSTERRAAVVQMATDWELPGVDARPARLALPTVPPIDAVTDSPGVRLAYRLPIDAAPGWVSFTMAAVCLAWNTLVAIFVLQVISLHREGQPNWLLTWLMVPFVMAGVWTLVALARQVLLNIAVGTTLVEVSQHPFYPGGTFHGFVSQTGRLRVRWLQVQLVCEEQAIYQQGTDTRRATSRVHRAVLFSQRKFEIQPQQPFEATFDVTLPASAMHSFASSHNAVMWSLVVCGRLARWGDFERRFPIYVYPLRVTAPPPNAPSTMAQSVNVTTPPSIRIVLDSPSGQYQPGDRLTGRFMIEGTQMRTVRAAELRCCGTRPAKGKRTWPYTISSGWWTMRPSRSICACRTVLPPFCRRAR